MDMKCNETHKHTSMFTKKSATGNFSGRELCLRVQSPPCSEPGLKEILLAAHPPPAVQNPTESWTGKVVTQAQRPRTYRTLQVPRINMQSWALRGSTLCPDIAGHQQDNRSNNPLGSSAWCSRTLAAVIEPQPAEEDDFGLTQFKLAPTM